MNHIGDESLALIALASSQPTSDEQLHLDECSLCRQELEALRHTVELGKESQGVTLESPPAAVWERIKTEISVSDDAPSSSPVHLVTPSKRSTRGARPRPRRLRLGVWIPVTAVIAAAAAVGGIIAEPLIRPVTTVSSVVVERASLESLPGWTGAHGTATLRRTPEGHLSLTIRMTPGTGKPSSVAGPLREVWLMKPDLSGLMSMGFINSTTATFMVPDGLDVSTYSLVDISAQAANGNPAHSGQSIMRGRFQQSS